MKRSISAYLMLLTACAVGTVFAARADAAQRGPAIRHDPVRVGVRGQSIAIRASVTDSVSNVKSVYLYYTVSRDASPYRLTMLSTGADGYLVTIPGALLGNAEQLSYYIEAMADGDRSAETPWYKVDLRAPQGGEEAASAAPAEKRSSWVKPTLYAGGAALLIGGAALAAGGGGGGGGGDSGDGGGTTVTNAGSYAGTVTTCFQLPSSTPDCSENAMRILVTSDGVVNSDTLREGHYVEGRLTGQDFLIVSAVNETNRTGEIRYKGTILNDRIAGLISGTARTTNGVDGVYSGTFTATAVRP